jgi:hypothetical protein
VKQSLGESFRSPPVPDDEWVSLWDAGRELGYADISPARTVMADGFLYGVRNAAGEPGVTRQALDKEKEWRRTAGPVRRFFRVVRSIVQYF